MAYSPAGDLNPWYSPQVYGAPDTSTNNAPITNAGYAAMTPEGMNQLYGQGAEAACMPNPYYGGQTLGAMNYIPPYTYVYTPMPMTSATTMITIQGTMNYQYWVTAVPNYQYYVYDGTITTSPFYEETAEQKAEREKKEAEAQALRDAADKRAREALLCVLDEKQKAQLEAQKHFDVEVQERLYRVKPGARVERINKKTDKVESYFCIHPAHVHELPNDDIAISQKLWLEADEKTFLAVANETRAY